MSGGALFGLPDGEGNSWFGQLFVMACYGYILYQAAVLIGDGSEKLLLIYGPGVVGGLLIPILGAVPDGAIVLVSGLGSAAEAQCQVSTGVGTLAGSTIMLLTIPWAISLFLGCRDQDPITKVAASKANGRPKYEDGFKPMQSCVTTYPNTVSGARIMICSGVSYLIVLIPAIIEKNAPAEQRIEEEHYPALVGFIVCAVAFVGYSVFQVWDSNQQTTQEMKQTKLKFIKWKDSVGRKIASTDVAIKMAFQKFDRDGNGTIDRSELQQGFKQLGLELDRSQVMAMMAEYNQDDDASTLTEKEFSEAIKKWSRKILEHQSTNYDAALQLSTIDRVEMAETEQAKQAVITVDDSSGDKEKEKDLENDDNDRTPLKAGKRRTYQSVEDEEDDAKQPLNQQEQTDAIGDHSDENKEKLMEDLWKELNMEAEMEEEEEEEEEQYLHLSDTQLKIWAFLELGFGTFLCCVFSDPMVSVIGQFSNTLGVSSFFVSFIVTPIASNAAEIYSSLIFASKKTKEGISMGFSALYGAACMNNTFVLCIFCALVFFRRLQWTFVAETLVILLTVIVVGINGMRETVTVWQGFLVITLFPLSLVLVAILDPLLDDVTKC
eukprot:CAMPEP_0197024010 /NCGR_PEP_ID=MMETSP1384-20130603/4663_1 /TAXON_ID=29189 /ORGANISM="Ammonia sp." /LENGTH=605 /DNA_ID=CAMNT_0042452335 /DNA_START=70 /DNA_END=1887 /DNA_ORIENTATION=+